MLSKIWFPAAILAALIFLLVHGSLTLPSSPMKFPWLIGAIGIILTLWQVIREVRSQDEETESEEQWQTYVAGVGWFLAIFPLVFILGFIVAAPIYVFTALKARGESWWMSVLLAIVMWIFVYFGLYLSLKVPLYEGLLFE